MQVASLIAILFCAILGVLTAPTIKPDADVTKEMKDELNQFKTKLSSLDDELKNIMDAVKKNSEPTKRQLTEKETPEPDPFISRVAKKVASKVSSKDPPAFIEGLVNVTAKHLVEKMNASHGDISEFKNKLKAAVLKLLNKRSMDEPAENESTMSGGVNPSKVMEAINEILRGPLISGFVSKEEEELMIRSAVEALSKDFGLSRTAKEDLIHAMTSYAAKELESLVAEKSKPVEPMDDGEKILGLEKMVEDKVEEKKLNMKEAEHVAKGLAAAVGARNKLSEEKTKELEKILSEGVEKYMKKKQEEIENTDISLLDIKHIPEGFREAQEAKSKRDYDFGKYMKGYGSSADSSENLFALMRKLQGKWNKVKYGKESDADKKSALETKKKQTEKLKEALKESIAEMDKLDTEKKKDSQSQKRDAVFVHCVSVEPVSSVNCPVSIEPSDPKPTEVASPTAGDNIVSKIGALSFDLAKQIEKAAAEIQKDLEKEVEKREDENEMKKEKELAQQEKESALKTEEKFDTEQKKESGSQKRTLTESTEAKPTQAASPTAGEEKIVSKIGALSFGLAKQIEKAAAEIQKNIEKEVKKQEKENAKQKEKQLAQQEKEKMKQETEKEKEKTDIEKQKEKEKMEEEKQKEKEKVEAEKNKKEEEIEKEKEEDEKEKEKEKAENEKEKEKEKEENKKEEEKEKAEDEKEKEKEKEENKKEEEKEKAEDEKEKEKEKEEELKEEGEGTKSGEDKESEAEAEKKESEVSKENEKIEEKIAKENEKIEDSKEEKEKEGTEEKDKREQKGEKRDQSKADKIAEISQEIEKELDEMDVFEMSKTTAKPTTAAKPIEDEAENELMAELDDIFQIKN